MGGLRAIGAAQTHRVRRFDAIVLGGALSGLAAAVRLGQRGVRVLVIEEEAAARRFEGLREPFLVTGVEADGIVGQCLRELGVPLIEQRRFAPEEIAFQVVRPDARIDFGHAQRTTAELTAWGLAKPDEVRDLLRALHGAWEAERAALLAAPIVRSARRRRWRAESAATPAPLPGARGLPREAVEATPPLRDLLDGLVAALCGRAADEVPPELRAYRLGGALHGAAGAAAGEGLRSVLRRRAQALLAEFRTTPGAVSIVSATGLAGVAVEDPDEICAGRALLLNAPAAALAAVDPDGAPEWLRGGADGPVRELLHYRGPRSCLPEGMAHHVVHLSRGGPPVTLRVFPGLRPDAPIDLVAAASAPAAAATAEALRQRIDRVVRSLLPFSENVLARVTGPTPRWDVDAPARAPRGGDWPSSLEIRCSSRPPIFSLDRASLGALGPEGDLLLGWRAGDAIADELP